ncbi:hypothetical protein [Tessaracoccus coleopterorum]|uniref:hypothetical protein n=1 Tax=Tessaracoccus coleopterorum TaxID=2714950 RepID=UPI0018D31D25|nr:hypothetical protein [Tessaracoccus coleopterorum]
MRIDYELATVEVEHLYGYDNDDWRWTPAPGVDPATAASWLPEVNTHSSKHIPQMRHLVDAMGRGVRPRVSGDDGRRVLELIAGMYKSALTGRRVTRAELTPDDPFYHAMPGTDPAEATARIHAATITRAI